MSWLEPITLCDESASLVPLATQHCEGLIEASQDGELWNLWATKIPVADEMLREIHRRLDLQNEGTMLPFTVLDRDDEPVGMTSYMNVDAQHRRLEIGSTWYAKSAQRTSVNTECKYLLLQHAFETLDCIAVEFRTSFFNHTSRQAIERLGAKLDGILRNHQRHSNGTLRDTCVYSVIQSEWPTVKAHLEFLLRDRTE